MSALYRTKFPTISFNTILVFTVERVLRCVWTSKSLALTMWMVPRYWLIENQSMFINESRNAAVLQYDF
jgi:hypothetical protein